VAEDLGEVEAVGVVEGAGEQRDGDGEADVVEVFFGREAVLGDVVDVEGELGADVLVRAFGVVDVGAVLGGERGELDADGGVDGLGVADGVAEVVGERADGEGDIVGVFGVAEEGADEVAGADVVEQVGEDRLAEGIVAEVLDDASAIGVGVGLAELGGSEVGVALEQQRLDGVGPGEVDDLFVGEDGVGAGRPGEEEPAGGEQNEGGREDLRSEIIDLWLDAVRRATRLGGGLC
jgi:hypothetical protein